MDDQKKMNEKQGQQMKGPNDTAKSNSKSSPKSGKKQPPHNPEGHNQYTKK